MPSKFLTSCYKITCMLYFVYSLILAFVTYVVTLEFLNEKRWKIQLAMAMVLLVFILRLLQIK
jgi:hypothetical protein